MIQNPSSQVSEQFDDLGALLNGPRRCGFLPVNDRVLEIIDACAGDLDCDRAVSSRAASEGDEIMEASLETVREMRQRGR